VCNAMVEWAEVNKAIAGEDYVGALAFIRHVLPRSLADSSVDSTKTRQLFEQAVTEWLTLPTWAGILVDKDIYEPNEAQEIYWPRAKAFQEFAVAVLDLVTTVIQLDVSNLNWVSDHLLMDLLFALGRFLFSDQSLLPLRDHEAGEVVSDVKFENLVTFFDQKPAKRDLRYIWWAHSTEVQRAAKGSLNVVEISLSKRIGSEQFLMKVLERIKADKLTLSEKEESTQGTSQLNKDAYEIHWILQYLLRGRTLKLSTETLGSFLPVACFLIRKSRSHHKLIGWGLLSELIKQSSDQSLEFHCPLIVQTILDQIVFRDPELILPLIQTSSSVLSRTQDESLLQLVEVFCGEYHHAVSGTYKNRPMIPMYGFGLLILFSKWKKSSLKSLIAGNLKTLLSSIFYVITGVSQDIGGEVSVKLLSVLLQECPDRMRKHKKKMFIALIQSLIVLSNVLKDQDSSRFRDCVLDLFVIAAKDEELQQDYKKALNDLSKNERLMSNAVFQDIYKDLTQVV
jgi:hypothetical protein